MAEETAPAATEPTTEPAPAETVTFTQEQVNNLIAKEKGKITSKYADYSDLKAAAAKLEEIESANATELEKAQKKAAELEARLAENSASALRQKVAMEKELPAKLVPFLTATDEEGLAEQAATLLENLKPETPDFNGGTREPAAPPESPEVAHNKVFLQALGFNTDQ
jgi:transcriptional regulator